MIFREVKLEDIANISMGQSPKSEFYNFNEEGLPFFQGCTEFGERYPTVKKYTTKWSKEAHEGDILMSVRAPVGTLNISNKHCAIGRGLASIKAKENIDQNFLFYSLKQKEKELNDQSSGTIFPSINGKQLKSLVLTVPELNAQKRIGEILRQLDDKIFTNTEMNKNLETIAQYIFKSWFVDFDPVKANAKGVTFDGLSEGIQALFPSELEESELGMIPKGWNASNIGKEFDVVMGQSPPGSSYNETGEGTLFFQGRRDFGFRYPAERVFTNAPKRLAKAGDTLLSVRAPVGDVNKALRDCCVGRGVGALRHKSGCESFTYYASKRLKSVFDNFDGEGTVFGSINQKELKALTIIAPSSEVMKKFNEIVTPIDERIKVNTGQINSLTKIRDKLLPKLISGKITIQKAEELLEEAS